MRKIIGLLTGISGIILTSFGVFVILKHMNDKPSIAIIGGADRPTAIFISSKIGNNHILIGIIVGLVLILISGILLFKKKR